MYAGKRVLGLIPARGGSKGIPGKNIRKIGGEPLIAKAIRVGLSSCHIDSVVVTTDDEEIARIARLFGARVPFMRPAELAKDSSRTIECVVHARDALLSMGEEYDAVALLQPTSPLRRVRDVDRAIELFYERGERGVVSVSRVKENPILIRTMGEDGELSPLLSVSSTMRRQDMPAFYRVDGGIYVNDARSLTAETSLNDNPVGIIIPEWNAIDIDDMDDWREAERRIGLLSLVGVAGGED